MNVVEHSVDTMFGVTPKNKALFIFISCRIIQKCDTRFEMSKMHKM